MILHEEGRLRLTDPVSKYLPEFRDLRVFVGGTTEIPRTEPARPMTIKHLLTHTSGLSYDDPEPGVPELYRKAKLFSVPSLRAFVERVAELPLVAQPGTEWHYSVSMDVLGRIVEVLSGEPFDRFLARRIFEPLGMVDTAFHVPDEKLDRFTANYERTAEGGMKLEDEPAKSPYRNPKSVPFGGHGLVSTAADYLRFATMLQNGGEIDGTRILDRKTVELMMMNHLGPEYGPAPLSSLASSLQCDPRGVGFGFTGSVITDVAKSSMAGSPGTFSWGGIASTYFWVDPAEDLIGLLMTQLIPSDAYPLRAQMRTLTYQALL